MERIDKILKHPLFWEHLEKNNRAEEGRIFCRHNMAHFLDVARIGMIMCLEEDCAVNRDWVYAAALLHDLGRHIQYETGVSHEIPGAEIAEGILEACGFDTEEQRVICEAIRYHRDKSIASEQSLRGILYRADKASRACFACEASAECNWKDDRKNRVVRY